jgi:hypothetical protein
MIELPRSFMQPASGLGCDTCRLGAASQTPPPVPLVQGDPAGTWNDLSTVANIVSIVTNLLRK